MFRVEFGYVNIMSISDLLGQFGGGGLAESALQVVPDDRAISYYWECEKHLSRQVGCQAVRYLCKLLLSTATIFANTEQYLPVFVASKYKDNYIYITKKHLQCRYDPSILQLFLYSIDTSC